MEFAHPMIAARAEKIYNRLAEIDAQLSEHPESSSALLESEAERLERELDSLAMEDADPSAHGYGG